MIRAFRICYGIRTVAVLALASALFSQSAAAESSLRLSGSLIGSVRDSAGVPQMGALVQLFNRHDKLVEKVITNANGEFGFDALLPDLYSVRVTLSSFMPALKRNISIQPAIRSVLAINLASVLSSVELVYSTPNPGTLMSDEWRWVLRSSMTSRPVLRMIPGLDLGSGAGASRSSAAVFSDTRGIVRVASGDTNPYSSGAQSDLGTSFALATSLFGSNQLQVSGKIGYALNSDLPSAGFRTSFSRTDVGGPEVKLMMQQVSVPVRSAGLVGGQNGNAPALRTMSVTLIERTQIADGIDFDYGASLDSVTFLDRLNYLSPFARLTYELGDSGTIAFGYSSGAPPVDLLHNRDKELDADLEQDMAALAVLPRVSLRNGAAYVQRTQNLEIGYKLEAGSRVFTLGAYRESVGNAALTLSAPDGFYYAADMLPDLTSNSSVFNIGAFQRYGYTAAVTQSIGEHHSATIGYGSGGVLGTNGRTLETSNPEELRGMITRSQRHWVRGKIAGIAPRLGTRYTASYEWTDYNSLTPGHVYLTQSSYPETGLNIRLRQPLPSFGGLPGRLEASADLRNLLAQGYLPISRTDGRILVLAHSPRSVRGGLSFIF